MKNLETIRIIKGKRYRCLDVGVDDLERAEYNRFIVANKLFTTFYEQMEAWFTHTPLNYPLPSWMPLGVLPEVSGRGYQQDSGEEEGDLIAS